MRVRSVSTYDLVEHSVCLIFPNCLSSLSQILGKKSSVGSWPTDPMRCCSSPFTFCSVGRPRFAQVHFSPSYSNCPSPSLLPGVCVPLVFAPRRRGASINLDLARERSSSCPTSAALFCSPPPAVIPDPILPCHSYLCLFSSPPRGGGGGEVGTRCHFYPIDGILPRGCMLLPCTSLRC